MVLVCVNRVFVVVAGAAALGFTVAVDARGQSVGDVVDLALEAVGGRAALASVADLRVSGSAELDYGLGPVEGVFELVIELNPHVMDMHIQHVDHDRRSLDRGAVAVGSGDVVGR